MGWKKLKFHWVFHRRTDKFKLPLIKSKEKGIFYKELCVQLWAKAKWYQIGQDLIVFSQCCTSKSAMRHVENESLLGSRGLIKCIQDVLSKGALMASPQKDFRVAVEQ